MLIDPIKSRLGCQQKNLYDSIFYNWSDQFFRDVNATWVDLNPSLFRNRVYNRFPMWDFRAGRIQTPLLETGNFVTSGHFFPIIAIHEK